MKIKLLVISTLLFSTQLFAESHQNVNPWPEEKLKDIEIMLKENDQAFDIAKNNDGRFISLKTNDLLNGEYEIDGTPYPFRNGLLHGKVFGATYRNGKLYGVMNEYRTYYDGSYSIPSFLSAKLNFVNGVPSGTQNWYDPSGNIIETAFYQNGKRLSHKKILQKIKTQNSDEAEYENEDSKVILKFLEICSKSKVKKQFDNRAHIYIYTGDDLDPNCLQKEYTSYRNNKYTITTYEDFPWGRSSKENEKKYRRHPTDDYNENVSFKKDDAYIKILSPVKEACAEGCVFEYDHLYFFDKPFIYITDFYGYYSYTSLEEGFGGKVINYGMSMLTHHRNYVYAVQDIFNSEQSISSFSFYGDAQIEKTSDSYTSVWEKKYWQGGGAIWISTKRNWKNEILKLERWGNVCLSISDAIFNNVVGNHHSFDYERLKIRLLAYLTRHPQPKWWVAALVKHDENSWCYEDPRQ